MVILIISIVFILMIVLIVLYNRIVYLNKKSEQALKSVDVYLKQRFDLIPNLVETVKGYANYEENLLKDIVSLRQKYDTINNDLLEEVRLNNLYNNILIKTENYSDIKASDNFMHLQKQLSKMESQLQAARRVYNSDATMYNTYINSFPASIISKIFSFKEKQLFETATAERENMNISF